MSITTYAEFKILFEENKTNLLSKKLAQAHENIVKDFISIFQTEIEFNIFNVCEKDIEYRYTIDQSDFDKKHAELLVSNINQEIEDILLKAGYKVSIDVDRKVSNQIATTVTIHLSSEPSIDEVDELNEEQMVTDLAMLFILMCR